MKIVDIDPAEEYTAALREYFEKLDLKMVEIGSKPSKP